MAAVDYVIVGIGINALVAAALPDGRHGVPGGEVAEVSLESSMQ